MLTKCQHENCKRQATTSNSIYFKDIWYCTYHANIATKEGRRKRKYGTKIAKNV